MKAKSHKSRRQKQIQKHKADCSRRGKLGVRVKEQKRIEQASKAEEVGLICFSGKMFEGFHIMRLLSVDGHEHLWIDIDGKPYTPKTVKGVRKMLAQRIWRK